MMGKLNCVSSLNAEALAWEKEEDATHVGQVTEREVFPKKARHSCLQPASQSMRFVKDLSYFFSQRVSQA